MGAVLTAGDLRSAVGIPAAANPAQRLQRPGELAGPAQRDPAHAARGGQGDNVWARLQLHPAPGAPHIAAAGSTPRSPFQPPITRIRYAGTNSDTGAQMRPTPALSRSSGSPVVTASVVIGIPMDPNATGAVLA